MEQLNLNWHTYNDHLKELMHNLMESHESTDVTLVCEDKTKFKAHQFVLKACSPVFQSIINDLPHKDPIIYLRGVLATEMQSILQFMYLGHATFFSERMNDFLNVARSLEIKEISNEVDCDATDSFQDTNMKYDFGNSHEEKSIVCQSNVEGKSVDMSMSTRTKLVSQKSEAGQFQCIKCEKHFSQHKGLIRHIRSAHEGLKFPCAYCSHKATTKQHLETHIQALHKRTKLFCDLCEFKTTQSQILSSHKKHDH